MDIADCYRLLQLTSRSNIDDLKASYRRLARKWHPDINPGDAFAHEKFIQVTEAYKTLRKIIPPTPTSTDKVTTSGQPTATVRSQPTPQVKVSVRQPPQPSPPPYRRPPTQQSSPNRTPPQQTHSAKTTQTPQTSVPRQPPPHPNHSSNPQQSSTTTTPLSAAEIKLKVDSYRQLQDLIQHQRFPRAVALIEALAQRLPQDTEVRQWQAIIYQSWGRQLIRERKLNQAKAYLKKALSTDPHNKSLWAEIEQDFRNLEMVF